jgi:hypothetical protein
MSTLDQADIDVMKAAKTCRAATRFQYDFLNDDIAEDGTIDYSLSGKLPQSLRDAIAAANAGKKKFLILMNPPYAEAMNADNIGNTTDSKEAERKKGVAGTCLAKSMNLGYAQRELFVQFLVRISREIPSATVAMFSTLKYVNAPNFELFREYWTAEFLDGFVVHSKAFDGIDGDFPIGFLIWKQGRNRIPDEISCDVINKDVNAIGEKTFYNLPKTRFLSKWIKRPRSNNVPAIPLKNAITPSTSTKDVRGTRWADGAIASMMCLGNDLQHSAQGTALFSSGFGSAGAFFVTPENLGKAAIVFAVRRLIKPTWLNDRDQFLQPDKAFPQEFADDCLIWMLFSGSNLTASADNLEWNGKSWSIVNHFIPFTEDEVNAPERFESDFMVNHLAKKKLSPEAAAVLDAGRELWKAYFERSMEFSIREKLKLNRADVGWYQIRNALKFYNETSDAVPVSFSRFESAYKTLSDKLRPQIFDYGFLK